MIRRVANKGVDLTVTTQNGVSVKIKILNFLASGVKLLRLDQQAVTTPDSPICAGDVLSNSSGAKYIVLDTTPDYFRAQLIRICLTMVTANNTVSIYRPTVTSNAQGGIKGHTEATVAVNVPCKIGTLNSAQNKSLDTNLDRFIMLLSKNHVLQKGDIVRFAQHYEEAKVETIKHDHEGVQEIIFDKDPRWTSV